MRLLVARTLFCLSIFIVTVIGYSKLTGFDVFDFRFNLSPLIESLIGVSFFIFVYCIWRIELQKLLGAETNNFIKWLGPLVLSFSICLIFFALFTTFNLNSIGKEIRIYSTWVAGVFCPAVLFLNLFVLKGLPSERDLAKSESRSNKLYISSLACSLLGIAIYMLKNAINTNIPGIYIQFALVKLCMVLPLFLITTVNLKDLGSKLAPQFLNIIIQISFIAWLIILIIVQALPY